MTAEPDFAVETSADALRLRLTGRWTISAPEIEKRADALRRGERLDESAPGSGLGLAIVDDLARAYSGSVQLSDSALGGLKVTLELPRTDF